MTPLRVLALPALLLACGGGREASRAPVPVDEPVPLPPLVIAPLTFVAGELLGPRLQEDGTLVAASGRQILRLLPEGKVQDASGKLIALLNVRRRIYVDGEETHLALEDDASLVRRGSDRTLTIDDEGRIVGMLIPSELRVEGVTEASRRTALFLYAILFHPREGGMLATGAFPRNSDAERVGDAGPEGDAATSATVDAGVDAGVE